MDFVRDNPGEPVPEETFTHLHLSWSSIVSYLLLPSNTIRGGWHPPCSIHTPDSLFPQSLSKFPVTGTSCSVCGLWTLRMLPMETRQHTRTVHVIRLIDSRRWRHCASTWRHVQPCCYNIRLLQPGRANQFATAAASLPGKMEGKGVLPPNHVSWPLVDQPIYCSLLASLRLPALTTALSGFLHIKLPFRCYCVN